MAKNSGFRGTIVNIADITIKGSVLKYRVLFTDSEGLVHAHTAHEVEFSEDSALRGPIQALLTACRRHAENLHFSSPATPLVTKEGLAYGIAESVSGFSDTSDEPGESG